MAVIGASERTKERDSEEGRRMGGQRKKKRGKGREGKKKRKDRGVAIEGEE